MEFEHEKIETFEIHCKKVLLIKTFVYFVVFVFKNNPSIEIN